MRNGSSNDMTFYDGVAAAAHRAPSSLAIECYGLSLNYAQLLRNCNRAANLIVGLGLQPGSRFAVMARNRIEYAELLIAAGVTGTVLVPIGPAASEVEIAFICEDSSARILFVEPDLLVKAEASAKHIIERFVPFGTAYDDLRSQSSDGESGHLVAERDVFCIPYTSGSTGRPKGVLLSQRGRVSTSFCVASDHGCFTARDRAMCVTPLFHGAGILSLLTPLLFGGAVNLLDKFDIETLLSEIARFRATSSYMIPTHFAALSDLGNTMRRHDVSSLKAVMCGTAPLDRKMLSQIDDFFGEGKLYQRYGSTETSVVACLHPEDAHRKPNSAGQPFPLVSVAIRRDDGSVAKSGESGTICVASPYMFDGYLNLPDATAAARDGDWFITGDIGYVDDEGYLHIVDRKNSMIITGGENVYPAEVERVILTLPEIEECAVVGLPHPYWGEAVTAFVVARADNRVDEQAIRETCRQALSRYKIPKQIVALEKLPRNAMGKIARDVLKASA